MPPPSMREKAYRVAVECSRGWDEAHSRKRFSRINQHLELAPGSADIA